MADATLRESFVTGSACAVYAVCANAEAQCWACVFPTEGIRPSEYVPRDPAIEHPITTALKAERKQARKQAKRSEASQRGRQSRSTGISGERTVAKLTGGQRQPGSGAYRGSLSNDVVADASLAHQQIEAKFGASYPLKTIYEQWLSKWQILFVVGHRTSFIVTTFDWWELRQWEGLSVGAVTSKTMKTWEDFLLDEAEKPEVIFARWPRQPMVVMQRIPAWIRHMAPEPKIDRSKLVEALQLLEEALE